MDAYIAAYLQKAKESLNSAQSDYTSRWYNSCANRCYYACFQAAIYALLRYKVVPQRKNWGHEFVKGQFVLQLIKRSKRYPGHLRDELEKCSDLRDVGDYESQFVTETQARRSLKAAADFVSIVLGKEMV